jgi:hypothetical protein
MELIGCVYLYVLLLQIEDWNIVFNVLWCILGVNIILFIMQAFNKDSVLNFGLKQTYCVLSVGNPMQAKSFVIILTALLIQRYQGIKKYLYLIYPALLFLAVIYWFDHKCWDKFCYARGGTWWESLRLAWRHPIMGSGLGSFKVLFPVLGKGAFTLEGNWFNAHNFFIQNLFEMGIIGYCVIAGFVINLAMKCKGLLMLGAFLVLYTLMFHFPDRQLSTVPLLILFIVIIERNPYGHVAK